MRRLLAPRRFDFGRLAPIRYVAVLGLPLALNVLGILRGILPGAPAPSFERTAELLAGPLSIAPIVVVVLLFGPRSEELGWRGYALDGLRERRSALAASLILGAVWAPWHWPQFFMHDSHIDLYCSLLSIVFALGRFRGPTA